MVKEGIKRFIFTTEPQRAQRRKFLSVGEITDRLKELFSQDLIFGRRPQDLLENRHLLSEPEASEPVADSPKIILPLCTLCLERVLVLQGRVGGKI
jgi:hypothetical protein